MHQVILPIIMAHENKAAAQRFFSARIGKLECQNARNWRRHIRHIYAVVRGGNFLGFRRARKVHKKIAYVKSKSTCAISS